MTRNQKLAAAVTLMISGTALIGWNLRDPDRAFREPPKVKRDVTVDQVPAIVRATIHRESAGGIVEDLEEEQKGEQTSYDVDIIRGKSKTKLSIAADGSVLERKSKKVKTKL